MIRIIENIADRVDNPTNEERFSVLIQKAIRDEQTAIELYKQILEYPDITAEQKEKIDELLSDEQDHLVILSKMISIQSQKEFPNSGEE